MTVDCRRRGPLNSWRCVEMGMNVGTIIVLVLKGSVNSRLKLLPQATTYLASGKKVIRSATLMTLEILQIDEASGNRVVGDRRWK